MKLQCQTETVNRLQQSTNMTSSGNKFLKSMLALGKEPKNDSEYFIIHFSSKSKNGVKYKIKNNIQNLFIKYINEGKATIRFKDPPFDLLIKCDHLQLKTFMKTLNLCLTGKVKELKLSNLETVGVTSKDTCPKKLVIRDRSEFPAKGMPRTLESVYINGIKMCNFRREILLLRHLTVLDISCNEIEKLPAELGRMPNICELHLGNNLLGINGDVDWRWLFGPQITKSLRLLDLTYNRIAEIPKAIWKLSSLVTLKLDSNLLDKLPHSLGRIKTLRFLTIAKNNLKTLPCSLTRLKLDYIDLSDNNFQMNSAAVNMDSRKPWDIFVVNLVSLAGCKVLQDKTYYAPNIIPYTLVETLDNSSYCYCGKPVLNDSISFCKKYNVTGIFRDVVLDAHVNSFVDFECNFCSLKCYKDEIK